MMAPAKSRNVPLILTSRCCQHTGDLRRASGYL